MNPIVKDVVHFISDGKTFLQVSPRKVNGSKWRVEFHFDGDQSENRDYECDQQQFMGWWKHTCAYIRQCSGAFADIDE